MKPVQNIIRLLTLPSWYIALEFRRRWSKCIAVVVNLPHIIYKDVALRTCLKLGIDRWYATKVLGWEFDFTINPKNPRDYHFHSPGGFVIYPRDYGYKNPSM